MGKQCQSCGMPLETSKAGDCRGSEKDGSKSELYCSLCYENGAFKQPSISLDEMKQVVDKALIEAGWIRPLRWMAKQQLPTLARWKQ